MNNVVVVGSQWGDEGKGKIVDWLSSEADVVVRFQGGHNAGHTLVIDGVTYKLRLLPSGIVRKNKISIIGNGVVVDPWALLDEIEEAKSKGVEINENNLISTAIKNIKKEFPEIILIADVALDPYTSHGHDGVLLDGIVDNDSTLDVLVEQSLVLANAGADIIAPSDMMDGRIKFIREVLENSNLKDTILLSYAAKYNSKFYGPFRDAVDSASNLGESSKSSYQMNPSNINEALQEVAMDINEGADIVMVKPAMPYLDVIHAIKQEFKIPTFAYQVSGEYSMLKLAIEKGWLHEDVMLESLLSIKRSGADAILTYAAKDIAKEISK